MSRLTEQDILTNDYTYSCSINEFEYGNGKEEIINKLGKLEDIEEELGCPLEVVFKALKQDYIYTKSGKHPHIELGTYGIMWCICCGLRMQLNIADYKKSWWLKEDYSE